MGAVSTGLLVDHQGAMSSLVDLMEAEWPDWYYPRGASARADLAERMQRGRLPLGIVGLVGEDYAGCCALTVSSGGLVSERSPWVSGLLVAPGQRRKGVAAALLERARREAGQLGYARLFALTAVAQPLFVHCGWTLVDTVAGRGGPHAVFAIAT